MPTKINLSEQVTGLLPIADINASGTPSAANFLRGDASWHAVTRDQVMETVITSSATSLNLVSGNSTYVFTGSAPTTWSLLPINSSINEMLILESRGSAPITLTTVGGDHIWLGGSITSMTIAPGGSLMLVNDGTYWNALSVDLVNNVVGILPAASGGTGASSLNGAGIEQTANKGATNGYAALASGLVPTAQLGTGAANSGSFLRGDQSWQYVSPAVYTTTIGNGSLTSFTINHNLGTRNIAVVVYNATTFEVVNCDQFFTTLNSVTLTFATAPAINAYTVVVLGGAMPSNTSVYTATIGDGVSTSIVINHNLGTRAVTVNLYNASTFAMCSADRVLTSVNSLTLTFQTAPALNSLVVVVQGGIISGLSSTAITDATTVGRNVLTAGTQQAARTAIGADALSGYGAYASRPAAGNTGAVYYCSDCDAAYRDNGTSWDKIRLGGSGGPPMADPPTTGWTALNMTNSTWAQSLDGMLFTLTATSTGSIINFEYRAYPTPPFTLTIAIEMDVTGSPMELGGANQYVQGGICISDGTKYNLYGLFMNNTSSTAAPWYNDTWNVGGQTFSSATAGNTNFQTYFPPMFWIGGLPRFYRYIDDGTNVTYQWSLWGTDWHTYYGPVSRTVYLAAPTRIGIGMWSTYSPMLSTILRLRSWVGVA